MNTKENGANQEDQLPKNDQKSKRTRKQKNERTNNKSEQTDSRVSESTIKGSTKRSPVKTNKRETEWTILRN